MSASHPIATELMQRREMTRCAKSDRMHRNKPHRYSITSSTMASTRGGTLMLSTRAV
jgi:hypothetical protein